MNDIILHHYDLSPFAQRAIKMLAIKDLAWRSVITPMIAPKPDLVALTGGYRGTPVMQIGADIYVDTQLIAVELERRFPTPSLFPNGNRGMPMALSFWGHAFFQAGLHMAIHELSGKWDEAFRKDREALFKSLDFATIKSHFQDACAALRAHASLVEAQLEDGRRFLQGDEPGLADVQAFHVPWFTLDSMPMTRQLLAAFPHVVPWVERVVALGEGARTEITAAEAHEVARRSRPEPGGGVDPDDPLGLEEGQEVDVRPIESERGTVRGNLLALLPNRVSLLRNDPKIGAVAVHFPRFGYEIRWV